MTDDRDAIDPSGPERAAPSGDDGSDGLDRSGELDRSEELDRREREEQEIRREVTLVMGHNQLLRRRVNKGRQYTAEELLRHTETTDRAMRRLAELLEITTPRIRTERGETGD